MKTKNLFLLTLFSIFFSFFLKDFINSNIPDENPVGLGDSITTCKLKVRNILSTKGVRIFYSWNGSENIVSH